jgi:hypothetical protein
MSGFPNTRDAWFIWNALQGMLLTATQDQFSQIDNWYIYQEIVAGAGGGGTGTLKVAAPLNASPQIVSDNDGGTPNFSIMYLSTGEVGFGAAPASTDRMYILSKGSTVAGSTIRVVNSLGAELFRLYDSGRLDLGTSQITGNGSTVTFARSTGAQTYNFAFDQFGFPGYNATNFGATRGIHPNSNNDRDLGLTGTRWRDLFIGNALNTGAPVTGTAGAWKLGSVNNTVHGGVDANNWVEIEIGGVLVKLAIVL